MTDDQHEKNLNAVTGDIQALSKEAYERILSLIGTAPASVIIKTVLKDYANEVQDAVDI